VGNAYVAGSTYSTDFPTTAAAFDRTCGTDGTCNPDNIGDGRGDAFVTKLDVTGSKLVYSTYLGGSGYDVQVGGIAVDLAGNAYVVGTTDSTDFPTTRAAFDRSFDSSGNVDVSAAFVTKLNAAGSDLAYSTYLGGQDRTYAYDVAVYASGYAYVTGSTTSKNFPTTPGAYDRTYNGGGYSGDAFVTKLDATGTKLVYSTYLGGRGDDDSGIGITVDAVGAAYVTGATDSDNFPTTVGAFDRTTTNGEACARPPAPCDDRFVTKVNATGSALLYSTYLGGRGYDYFGGENAGGIAVDAAGNVYVTGQTNSHNFPTTPGAFDRTYGGTDLEGGDAFVTALDTTGSRLLYSTYLGGSGTDAGNGIAVNTAMDDEQQVAGAGVYVAGRTGSSNFPTTEGAFDRNFDGGDAFVTKLALGAGDTQGGSDDQQDEDEPPGGGDVQDYQQTGGGKDTGAGAVKTPDNQQGGGKSDTVTKTFELILNGTVPEGETFVVRYGVSSGDEGQTSELFLCGEGAQDQCIGDGAVYSGSIEVPAGAQIDFEFERAATGEVFHVGNETITADMTNTAWYTFGMGTGAGDGQEVPDNQQDGEDKDADTDTGAGEVPDNQQDDTQDDVQDDQQGEMPEEMPDTGMGGLVTGATTPVGNAASGLTMLLGAGYAVIRRR
jgi:hypothetical protein